MRITIITFLILTWSLWAQEPKDNYVFSLQQAIEHGLKYNVTAINAGKDVEASKKKKWETTAMGLPQINAGIDYQRNFAIQQSIIPAEFLGGEPGEFVEVAFGTRHTALARATLSQLIFDGSYLVALQASKTYLSFYENLKVKTERDLKEQIVNAYTSALLVDESISILEKNKATLDKNLSETKEIYKNGLTEEESVEQLTITLASVDNSLRNMQRLKTISYNMLKIQLGLELEDQLILTDPLDQLTLQHVMPMSSESAFDINNNIDYQLVLNNEEQKRLLMLQEKSMALPSLSANLNFGYNAFSQQFDFLNRDARWLNFSSLGMSLNIPIFSSLGRTARTQQAKIEMEKAKLEKEDFQKKLNLQFQQSFSEYEFSIENYNTNKSNLRLAERIEGKQQIKFKEGLSTSFEFTEAQRQLYGAQQDYLQSMVEVINKKAALEKILNQ
ncbi:MAG: TolC family protein [Flavobacterium sp.]